MKIKDCDPEKTLRALHAMSFDMEDVERALFRYCKVHLLAKAQQRMQDNMQCNMQGKTNHIDEAAALHISRK